MDYEKRIKYLEKKYSETNVAKGEILSADTRKQINKTYYDNQQKRRVDAILNNVKNKDMIKVEVHDIISNTKISELCPQCKEEVIVACIIVYCLKARDSQFRPERSKIWKQYDITWQRYGLITTQLLKKTRAKGRIKPKPVDLNQNHIRW